ncbi:hypothetical protein [Mesorhizobium sp. M0195]|uniref:alpha/beta fold hydrolase n=1 Tax=unclassified Mesorhizobium TaxID=325217 RepID=UPI003338CA44
MFEGFSLEQIKLPEATLRVRVGGRGHRFLMLHGHPRTHATWDRVAPILAEEYTVICPGLRCSPLRCVATQSARPVCREQILLMHQFVRDGLTEAACAIRVDGRNNPTSA